MPVRINRGEKVRESFRVATTPAKAARQPAAPAPPVQHVRVPAAGMQVAHALAEGRDVRVVVIDAATVMVVNGRRQ